MTSAQVGRVFKADQPRPGVVLIVRSDPAFQNIHIQQSVCGNNRADRHTAQRRRSATLEIGDMTGFVNEEFVARQTMHAHAHLVALCSRTGEHGGFVSEHVGDEPFQSIDRRIFAHDVIANFGSDHGLQHCRRWPSDRITAKIDDS